MIGGVLIRLDTVALKSTKVGLKSADFFFGFNLKHCPAIYLGS